MATGSRKPNWTFYLGWVASNAISVLVAWGVAWVLVSQIEKIVGGTIQVGGRTRITEDFILPNLYLLAVGLVAGLLQALLLRRYLSRMGWWVAATVGGWLLPFAVVGPLAAALSPDLDVPPLYAAVIEVALIGGSMGLAQWLVLRKRVRHAAWWILASVVGWQMAAWVAGDSASIPLDLFAFGLLPSAAGGIAWWLLLDRLPTRESLGTAASR
jgi:hypothetical protein